MVPIPDSAYFPPLEKCLDGEQHLISWRIVFIALSNHDDLKRPLPALEAFLTEPYVLQLLGRPYNPFSSAKSDAKSAFETKTAAINITPTTKREYTIAEIKDDALWLSKQAEIDELSALRLIVLEYQTRPSAQLNSSISEEEAASLHEAVDDTHAESLIVLPHAKFSSNGSAEKSADFGSQKCRRVRAIRLYLSERRYLLNCAGHIFQAALDQQSDISAEENREKRDQWLCRVGQYLLRSLEEAGRNIHDCLLDSIRFLSTTFKSLEAGSRLFKDVAEEDLEIDWLTNNIVEAIHTMEIVFRILYSWRHAASSDSVLEWFRFASTYGFFDNFEFPFNAMEPLIPSFKSLVAVISLSLLDPQRSLEAFYNPQDASQSPGNSNHSPYTSDLQTLTEVNKILVDAASGLSSLASPAVLAWSIILKAMRDASMARKEARELRQSVRAQEVLEEELSFDEDISSGPGNERPRPGRRLSAGSDASAEVGVYDEFLETIKVAIVDEDPVLFLGASAIEGSNVFDVLNSLAVFFGPYNFSDVLGTRIRSVILDLTRCSIEVVDYTPEVVTATLAALTGGQEFWDLADSPPVPEGDDLLTGFLQDSYFMEKLLLPARSRFPYERLPFLKIIRAVASCLSLHDGGLPFTARFLQEIPSITYQLPQDFRDYETTQEEDNANTIQLTQDIPLFQPRHNLQLTKGGRGGSSTSLALLQIEDEFILPAGTQGRIVSDSDSGPKVAIWFREYSGLKYFGKLLETALTANDCIDATTGQSIDRESLTEIVGILATLLMTSTKIELDDSRIEPRGSAYHILQVASDGLERNHDIVTVIFKIFEEELQRQSGSEGDESLDVLIATIQFIYALVPILPGRVWPLLGRSELLDIDGRGGKLATIIGRVEIIRNRYDFLISCVHLFNALVEDSVEHTVLRKVGSKSLVRFGTKEDLGAKVPEQIVSKVLLSFTRALVVVFESACNWRFALQEQRLKLSELTSSVFHRILHYTHGVDDSSDTKTKLTRDLFPAAEYIIDSFLSTSSGHLRFRPILCAFVDAFSAPTLAFQSRWVTRWLGNVRAALQLTTTLVKLGTLLQRPTSQLERQLFKVSPLVARLYAVHETYRPLVLKLLEALVLSASSREEEPPSLLGHLGRQTSKNFISMLLNLDKPLENEAHFVSIWHLMSAVISSRQQWFSIYLLTGHPPREALTGSAAENKTPSNKTSLKIALKDLSNIENLPMQKALAMLEFISLAQNFWPWAMVDLHLKDSKFIKSIFEYVGRLEIAKASEGEEQSMKACYQDRIAGYIAEVLAMYLYHCRQIGNTAPAKEILPHMRYYTRYAVAAPSYNDSLHGNLKRNFETKFTGCSLQNFKRTKLDTREYGREYFYDIQLADKMLNSDEAWTGKKNNGFAKELAMANVNLSLVDAQVALLHGWKLLAVELSTNISDKPGLQVTLAKIVKDCLIANKRNELPDNIFVRLNQTRADFALILLQRLVVANHIIKEVLDLLSTVWEVTRTSNASLEVISTDVDVEYNRTLLRMLFLAIRAHTTSEKVHAEGGPLPHPPPGPPSPAAAQKMQESSATTKIVVEVLREAVARGFRDLVATVHERPTKSIPEDIALLTAILQACLRFPGIEFAQEQIHRSMAEFDVPRVATTLFSWSDRLAIDGDPIYGELSILFLLELSILPVMAEQLAMEGTIGHISTANITSYMRWANISPLADGLGPQRCYSIWVRGILPLLLNILYAVGTALAAEIAIFLNQFPKLLQQSVEAIEVPHSTLSSLGRASHPPPRITYLQISECHSLALLIHVLSSFRVALAGVTEIPEVKWDSASVLENVELWLLERTVLRERILPVGLREMEMAKSKPSRPGTGCENRLEEKVVDELKGLRDVLTGADE